MEDGDKEAKDRVEEAIISKEEGIATEAMAMAEGINNESKERMEVMNKAGEVIRPVVDEEEAILAVDIALVVVEEQEEQEVAKLRERLR
jgi:hypothetical protein